MKIAFTDESFAFEFVRNLGFRYYGGADIGEMMATAGRIQEGDFESWFTEWDQLARRVLARADESLGASTYFRTAEFYLHGNPTDPRILSASRASQRAYTAAAKLTGPTWGPVEISYEGTTLPGYFYKADTSGQPRPTLLFHGGYDSSVEELFYFGAAAVRRGYNCLTFDGPGQGAPKVRQQLPFRFDWEEVVTPVVDYALSRPEVNGGQLVLMGLSLGGYLAARAAAFEPRFRAAIFFDGVYDFYGTLQAMLPAAALAALDAGDPAKGEAIIRAVMAQHTGLRWAITQGVWSLGAAGIADYVEKTKPYTMAGIISQITCPCLVLEAEGDIFFQGQPQRVYDGLQAPKRLVKFTSEDAAENHCQSGALAFKDEVVFNWLDEALQRPDTRWG